MRIETLSKIVVGPTIRLLLEYREIWSVRKKEMEISKRRCKDIHSRGGFLNDQLSSMLAKGCFISPD